jgi:hypothetical protein
MERVGDRQEKMEGYCSTGQSPQWAVVPMEKKKNITSASNYVCSLMMIDRSKHVGAF